MRAAILILALALSGCVAGDREGSLLHGIFAFGDLVYDGASHHAPPTRGSPRQWGTTLEGHTKDAVRVCKLREIEGTEAHQACVDLHLEWDRERGFL